MNFNSLIIFSSIVGNLILIKGDKTTNWKVKIRLKKVSTGLSTYKLDMMSPRVTKSPRAERAKDNASIQDQSCLKYSTLKIIGLKSLGEIEKVSSIVAKWVGSNTILQLEIS